MKLVIQIPCLNEENSLPITISELPKEIKGIDEIELLVIDDGSKDRTSIVAKECGAKEVIKFNKNRGLAHAFTAGITRALEMGADIIVNTDADNQYNGKDIEKLISPILEKQADIVIGTRPVSKIEHFSFLKKSLQRLGSFVMRLVSGTEVEDAPSGFRAFSRNAALQMNVFDNYTYTLETIIQSKAKNLILQCIPIEVNPEMRESRLFKNMFSYIIRSVFTMLRMFIIYRPFRFFAIIGLFFLGTGTLLGLRFLYYYLMGSGNGHIQSLILAAILLITGVQVGLIAVLSELLSINRKLLEDIQKRIKLEGLKNNQDVLK